MRLFVCSFLNDDNRAYFDRLVAALAEAHPDRPRAIPSQSAHVTYAFMAHLEPGKLDDVAEAVSRAVSGQAAIEIGIGAASVSYTGAQARLVHAPILHGEAALAELTRTLGGALDHILPVSGVDRSRSPHVTLARFRKRSSRASARPIVEALMRQSTGSTLRADRVAGVQLVSSELTSRGPVYLTMSRIQFKVKDPV